MPTTARPGAAVFYETWGDAGPWVTLVNGHMRPLNDFRMLGKNLVERGFRVLALDNRGAGRTVVAAPFRLGDMADDVAALWDLLGIDRGGLLGISMGGFIALEAALAHPTRVSRLVLVSTAMGPEHIRPDDSAWSADEVVTAKKLAPYFTEDFARRNETMVRSMARQIARAVADGDFQRQSELQRAAVRGFDASARAGGVGCPTLVIHGAEDRVVGVEAGRQLARRIPGATLSELAAAGHLLLAEKPRELYAAVGDFFAVGATS